MLNYSTYKVKTLSKSKINKVSNVNPHCRFTCKKPSQNRVKMLINDFA